MGLGQASKANDPKLVSVASALKDSVTLYSEPMSRHTSFGIGGPCDLLVMPKSAHDAVSVWRTCKALDVPCTVIGNGTNLLIRDGGVRGCLIKMAPSSSDIEFGGDSTFRVSAGTLLPRLVQEAMQKGLSGLEWAIGIPGSIGGAVTMNAGAYGGDFGSLVTKVEVAGIDGQVWSIDSSEIGFSYRHSLFSSRSDLLILSAEIKLAPGDKNAIRELMMTRAKERETKQPINTPSAGSAFRRPAGYYVGKMIEELGLKGMRIGGAQVSPKHAGFIVNTGGATSEDVEGLISLIQAKVKEAYGVELEPEIVILGEDAASDDNEDVPCSDREDPHTGPGSVPKG